VESATHARTYSHGPRLIPTSSTSVTVVEASAIVEKQSDEEQLTPERSLELVNHSPSGFEWGYGGSGPAQLALALLLDYTDDEEVALAEYKTFKTEVVSQLECTGPDGCWRLTGREIDAALREIVDDPVAPSVN